MNENLNFKFSFTFAVRSHAGQVWSVESAGQVI